MNEEYGVYFPLCVQILGEDFSIYQNGKGGFEFQVACPYCGKKKLCVNLDTGLVKCWSAKCPSSGKLGKFEYFLANHKEITIEEAREIVRESVTLDSVLSIIQERDERITKKAHEIIQEKTVILPPNAQLYGKKSKTIANWLMNLRSPSYTKEEALWIMEHFPFYHSDGFRMEDRAIFEVTTLDRTAYLAYHMYSRQRDVQKTINPSGGVLSTMLLNYNMVATECKDRIVYVCEGAFSMMRVLLTGRLAVACFGSTISATQGLLLSMLPAKQIVVLFDNDAKEKARKSYEYLSNNFSGNYSWHYIQVEGKDPDDLGTIECDKYLTELESGTRKTEEKKLTEFDKLLNSLNSQ